MAACGDCLQCRGSVVDTEGFFVPEPAALEIFHTDRSMCRCFFFSRKDLRAVSTVPSSEGFASRLTDGSGMDSCLDQRRIEDQKLQGYNRYLAPFAPTFISLRLLRYRHLCYST